MFIKRSQKSFQYIEDKYGDFWLYHNHAMHRVSNSDGGIHCHDIDHGIDLLKSRGHITETPLEKALEAVDKLDRCKLIGYSAEKVQDIIRTLYEEMVCQSKN